MVGIHKFTIGTAKALGLSSIKNNNVVLCCPCSQGVFEGLEGRELLTHEQRWHPDRHLGSVASKVTAAAVVGKTALWEEGAV